MRRVAALAFAILASSCRSCSEERAPDPGPYIDDGYQPPMPTGMLVPLPPPEPAEEEADAAAADARTRD